MSLDYYNDPPDVLLSLAAACIGVALILFFPRFYSWFRSITWFPWWGRKGQ